MRWTKPIETKILIPIIGIIPLWEYAGSFHKLISSDLQFSSSFKSSRVGRGCDFRFLIDGLLVIDQSSNRRCASNFRVARQSSAFHRKSFFFACTKKVTPSSKAIVINSANSTAEAASLH